MPRSAKGATKPKLNRSQAVRDYLAQNPTAGPAAIRAALRLKGILITTSLASAVKYAKKGPGRPRGRRAGRPRSMRIKGTRVAQAARNSGTNKSDAVRAYLSQNPAASPAAIQAALRGKGILISTSLASAVKYAKKRPGRPKGRRFGRPVGRQTSIGKNDHLRAEDLLEAKRFVERVGGVGAARKALDLLAQLR